MLTPMSNRGKTREQHNNLRREHIFKSLAKAVFTCHLGGPTEFEQFYSALTDKEKDLFLGVASKYVFLVKHGDWHVDWEGCEPVIDYFTNSFKLVSLFSLIESLSNGKHEDFHDWLLKQGNEIFPVKEKSHLSSLHREYKKSHGSIRRCIAFFERLPPARQIVLRSGFKVNGQPVSEIRAVAQFLYNLRSKFVHEGEFVLDIASVPVMSCHKNTQTVTAISIPTLLLTFEEGVIACFRRV